MKEPYIAGGVWARVARSLGTHIRELCAFKESYDLLPQWSLPMTDSSATISTSPSHHLISTNVLLGERAQNKQPCPILTSPHLPLSSSNPVQINTTNSNTNLLQFQQAVLVQVPGRAFAYIAPSPWKAPETVPGLPVKTSQTPSSVRTDCIPSSSQDSLLCALKTSPSPPGQCAP